MLASGAFCHHKFTGKEGDADNGLDNFGARYNPSNMGNLN